MTDQLPPPGEPGPLSKRRVKQGEGGKFVSLRRPAVPPELADEPAPPRAPPPAPVVPAAPPPRRAAHPEGSTSGTGKASIQPPPSVLAAVLQAIEDGDFQADAFAAQGIPWAVASAWLKLGDASARLHAEDGRPLTWQGDLFVKVQRAEALSVSGPMKTLAKQAKETGGELAVKYLKVRRGIAGGGQGSARLGRDYEPQDPAAGAGTRDRRTDEDMLRTITLSISQARDAARARTRETGA